VDCGEGCPGDDGGEGGPGVVRVGSRLVVVLEVPRVRGMRVLVLAMVGAGYVRVIALGMIGDRLVVRAMVGDIGMRVLANCRNIGLCVPGGLCVPVGLHVPAVGLCVLPVGLSEGSGGCCVDTTVECGVVSTGVDVVTSSGGNPAELLIHVRWQLS